MPLTKKGRKIMAAMTAPASQGGYGPKKGEAVFYASRNAGRITGVDKPSKGKRVRLSKGK